MTLVKCELNLKLLRCAHVLRRYACAGEHEKLRAENEKLAKAKADMAKKVKELGDKVGGSWTPVWTAWVDILDYIR